MRGVINKVDFLTYHVLYTYAYIWQNARFGIATATAAGCNLYSTICVQVLLSYIVDDVAIVMFLMNIYV